MFFFGTRTSDKWRSCGACMVVYRQKSSRHRPVVQCVVWCIYSLVRFMLLLDRQRPEMAVQVGGNNLYVQFQICLKWINQLHLSQLRYTSKMLLTQFCSIKNLYNNVIYDNFYVEYFYTLHLHRGMNTSSTTPLPWQRVGQVTSAVCVNHWVTFPKTSTSPRHCLFHSSVVRGDQRELTLSWQQRKPPSMATMTESEREREREKVCEQMSYV